jgi:hypothetical protein
MSWIETAALITKVVLHAFINISVSMHSTLICHSIFSGLSAPNGGETDEMERILSKLAAA